MWDSLVEIETLALKLSDALARPWPAAYLTTNTETCSEEFSTNRSTAAGEIRPFASRTGCPTVPARPPTRRLTNPTWMVTRPLRNGGSRVTIRPLRTMAIQNKAHFKVAPDQAIPQRHPKTKTPMPLVANARNFEFSLPQLHAGQAAAYWALQPHRFKVLRCGRRFGKTELAKTWIVQGLLQGCECACTCFLHGHEM
jgi:hypothetical protein